MRILLSSNPQNLAAALAAFASTVTVEAEYGETVVEGSILTLAHHGLRDANPAPCLAENGVAGDPEQIEAVGLSHFDLDSLGGVLAVLGHKPEPGGFWELSAHVDVHGPHKLSEAEATEQNVRRLYAFWAWSQTHRVMPSRDGSVTDVADQVQGAEFALRQILAEEGGLLEAGDEFRLAEDALNKRSFVQMEDGVIVRVADAFTNHLYATPEGELAKAVVAFNTVTGGITMSLADPIPGVSAREIVQGLWGAEAGGQAGIAGSPRGQRMTLANLYAAFAAVQLAISGGPKTPENTLPEKMKILRLRSDYYGSHPEIDGDTDFMFAIPDDSGLGKGDFSLTHGSTYSPSWGDLRKIPEASLIWEEEWKPFLLSEYWEEED